MIIYSLKELAIIKGSETMLLLIFIQDGLGDLELRMR